MNLSVRLAFHSRGFTHYKNLLNLFKGDYHPIVLNGKMRANEIVREFEEGLKMFEKMKEFLMNARIANDVSRIGLQSEVFGGLGSLVFKQSEFAEWFKFYSFEEDVEYRFEDLFKDVFGVR